MIASGEYSLDSGDLRTYNAFRRGQDPHRNAAAEYGMFMLMLQKDTQKLQTPMML